MSNMKIDVREIDYEDGRWVKLSGSDPMAGLGLYSVET
jgi:hypothetical protein